MTPEELTQRLETAIDNSIEVAEDGGDCWSIGHDKAAHECALIAMMYNAEETSSLRKELEEAKNECINSEARFTSIHARLKKELEFEKENANTFASKADEYRKVIAEERSKSAKLVEAAKQVLGSPCHACNDDVEALRKQVAEYEGKGGGNEA